MSVLASHIHSLWGRWWMMPLLPSLYALVMAALGDLRTEHVGIAILCAGLSYASLPTKRFFANIWPYLLVAFGYDLVRYARQFWLTSEMVFGCALRDFELSLFSAAPDMTYQDWFHEHNLLSLDLIFAVPYAIFAYVVLGYAIYLYFKDRERMRYFLWAFVIGNYIAFTLWMIIPAAPPWYLRAHGCTIDTGTLPSAAGLLRVDAFLGMPYFENFYSRSAWVFGAMPSMHCAFPMMGLLTAWSRVSWVTRPIHILYVVVMFCAAIYLDHHWIVDGLAGWMIAVVSVALSGWLIRRSREHQPGQRELAPAAS